MKKILIFVLLLAVVVGGILLAIHLSGKDTPPGAGSQTVFVPAASGETGGIRPGEDPGSAPSQPGTPPEPQPGTPSGAQPGNEPGGQSGTQPGNQTGPEPGTQPGTQTDPEPGTRPGNQTDPEPGTQTDPEPGTQPGTQTDPEPGTPTVTVADRVNLGKVPGELVSTLETDRLCYTDPGEETAFFEVRFIQGKTAAGLVPSFLDSYLHYTEIEFLDLEPVGAARMDAEHLTARGAGRTADAWLLDTTGGVLSFVVSYTENTDSALVQKFYALLGSMSVNPL